MASLENFQNSPKWLIDFFEVIVLPRMVRTNWFFHSMLYICHTFYMWNIFSEILRNVWARGQKPANFLYATAKYRVVTTKIVRMTKFVDSPFELCSTSYIWKHSLKFLQVVEREPKTSRPPSDWLLGPTYSCRFSF